jgi:hypothetical protein
VVVDVQYRGVNGRRMYWYKILIIRRLHLKMVIELRLACTLQNNCPELTAGEFRL